MMRLSGDAFYKLELLDPLDFTADDGVERFIAYVKSKYQPIETHRVGEVMDRFIYQFDRKIGEEILDYDTRFARELQEAESIAGKLEETWKAHLYLKKMRLPLEKESQVVTGALGVYTVVE